MSHKATNWAISQRGLKPAAKLILWHLSDCHNGHTGRCDPSQERLAYDVECSRSTLNLHLETLEKRGLIQRQKRYDKAKKVQKTTIYILGFDLPDTQNEVCPVSENRTRKAVSEKTPKPSPKKAESRVLNSDTNLGIEPGIEPCADRAKEPSFEDYWEIYPRPRNKLQSKTFFNAAVKAGASPNWILQSAKSYAIEQAENDRKYIAYSDNWLEAERWQDYPLKPVKKEKVDIAKFWAETIKNGGYISMQSVTARLVDEMLSRELLTEQDLDKRRISY